MNKLIILLLLCLMVLPTHFVFASDDAMTDMIGSIVKPEDITSPMGRWEKFLNSIEIIGLHTAFWLLFILFIGLITLITWLPVKLYPYIQQHSKLLKKLLYFDSK